ncbi:hypothetical protein B0O99DRAFT_696101 [Bisporella sp. PMI_857]|nr:hypothetical protein B0O99DRAFT_696101 [Bisporella sp. PMI_857]
MLTARPRAPARAISQCLRQRFTTLNSRTSRVSRLCKQRLQSTYTRPSLRPRLNIVARGSELGHGQRRHESFNSRAGRYKDGVKGAFREYPLLMKVWVVMMIYLIYKIIQITSWYQNYIIGAFAKFPEPVAKELRKALYYTNVDIQPGNALKYWQKAIKVTEELGMDRFSDEVMGIKIEFSHSMEKLQQYRAAIQILEYVKMDNLKWMDLLGDQPGKEADRSRILAKTVAVSNKLGELYSSPHVLEKENAEEHLVWAVETALKETQRREKEGVKPDEIKWMTSEEIGGVLEMLAHHYEKRDAHYLAAPLFLQALSHSPATSCHSAVLMNNLSISLAQQVPPPTPGQPPISRAALVGNARSWAEKAIDVCANIKPPERSEECDTGCAVATHNLGEFAEMDGNIREARARYEEARSIAKAIGFKDGVANSDAGLKRIENK